MKEKVDATPKRPPTKVILSFCLVGSIFLAIYGLFGWFINEPGNVDVIALRPQPGPNQYYDEDPIPGIKKESFFIKTSGGEKIHCWLFRVPGASDIGIVNHGNAGNVANRFYIANALTKAECSALLYDYRGYGISSGGRPTLSGILDDGLIVYDYVEHTMKYPSNKILLYGESIGTAVTCNTAVHRPCAGVILQSGITSLPEMGKKLFPMLNLYPTAFFPHPRLNNLNRIGHIKAPILLIHGKKDTIVPYDQSQKLYDRARGQKSLVFLNDCGHNDMGVQNTEQFQGAIKSFVAQIFSTTQPAPQPAPQAPITH